MTEPDHTPEMPDAPEPPPRFVGAMAIVRWVILALAAVAAVGSWWTYAGAQHESASAVKYQCPMHPQIVSDHPGECPICHMSLEPVSPDRMAAPDSGAVPMPAAQPDRDAPVAYTCPMHPQVVSDHPGGCPICKMDLVAVAPVSPAGSGPPAPGSIPPGTAPIHLALDRVQAIGVRTAKVEKRKVDNALRATATVSAPEQNVAEVHVRASGFVESVHVRETGVQVKRGQPLISFYSPEIYQAQSELLATKDWPSFGDAGGGRADLARSKLALLGVPGPVVDQVLAGGKPMRAIGVGAPISGWITKKNVVLGSYVTPEMTLYEVVDLSRVYIVADIFQRNIARVGVGTAGKFVSSSRPDVTAEAKVDLVYPQVNLEARTTRVRMQVQNEKLKLLPGEYGTVSFAGDSQMALVIPRDSVVDTGTHTYVFVETGPGQYSPRTVELGAESGNDVEVRQGLAEGETVVSGATFLIDSESRLQASFSSTVGAAPAAPTSGCDRDFDSVKFPDKYAECRKCEQVHRGMGSMVDDCKNAIPKPWR